VYARANWTLPTCLDDHVARVDAFFQITLADMRTSINALHGKLDRTWFED
jgi:hypothetical protein